MSQMKNFSIFSLLMQHNFLLEVEALNTDQRKNRFQWTQLLQ